MSRVDHLIKELSPGGVQFKRLDDIAKTVPGLTGKSKAAFSDGNARFVSYKNVFANPAVNQNAPNFVTVAPGEKQNRLHEGDVIFTGSSETADEVGMSSVVLVEPSEPLYLNSFCFIVRFSDQGLLLPGFCKYLFRGESMRTQIRGAASGVTRINISKGRFMRVRVPVPPIEVQREIVRILDSYSSLEAELKAELEAEREARRLQYAHYRDALMAFPSDPHVLWIPMGEVGEFLRGRRFVKSDIADDGIPAIHYGEIYTRYGASTTSVATHLRSDLASSLRYAQPGDVVIVDVGETVADVGKAVAWLGTHDVAIHDHSFAFRHLQNPAYVSYYLQTAAFQREKAKYVARTKVKTLSMPGIARIKIPVPPLARQERIVGLLDKWETLLHDLSVGLLGELNDRRQQYEYYRDKLLTFEEAVA